VIERINIFMKDIGDIKTALELSNCPTILTNFLYFPFYFFVMLLNCIQEGVLWWIIVITFWIILTGAFGAFVSVIFTLIRGYSIYNSRFEEEEKK
jgi:hypothetical protein